MRADLHLHTTASDGALTPSELLSLAKRRGLDCIAITDHDTTAGLEEALQLQFTNPQILTGLELSCAPAAGESHVEDIDLLAYAFDPQHQGLRTTLQCLNAKRQVRGRAIVARLRDLELSINWEQVRQLATGDNIGRPHIARALVEAGHVQSYSEAFERYLRKGASAHISRWRLTAAEYISLIHEAGGVAVIAHPGRLQPMEQRILSLLPLGLDGIEITHPQHNPETTAQLQGLAKKHGLLMTGGSDFHQPDAAGAITLGRHLAPQGCVKAIHARARKYRT